MKSKPAPWIFVVAGLLCGGGYVLAKLIAAGQIDKLSAAAALGQVIGGALAGLLMGVLSGLCFTHFCGGNAGPAGPAGPGERRHDRRSGAVRTSQRSGPAQ